MIKATLNFLIGNPYFSRVPLAPTTTTRAKRQPSQVQGLILAKAWIISIKHYEKLGRGRFSFTKVLNLRSDFNGKKTCQNRAYSFKDFFMQHYDIKTGLNASYFYTYICCYFDAFLQLQYPTITVFEIHYKILDHVNNNEARFFERMS